MTYLLTQIVIFIIAAALLGFIVGWMLRSVKGEEKVSLLAEEYEERIKSNDSFHQQELDEFADNAKSMRAEVARLATNNTALRKTIDQNNKALELAHDEISQLSWKLKETETFNQELQSAAGLTDDMEDPDLEFDETIAEELVGLEGLPEDKTIPLPEDPLVDTRDNTIAEENAGTNDNPVENKPLAGFGQISRILWAKMALKSLIRCRTHSWESAC